MKGSRKECSYEERNEVVGLDHKFSISSLNNGNCSKFVHS
jgi:hypothetical protein